MDLIIIYFPICTWNTGKFIIEKSITGEYCYTEYEINSKHENTSIVMRLQVLSIVNYSNLLEKPMRIYN